MRGRRHSRRTCKDNPADLVITGVQAPDDLDGQLPPALAAHLGEPHASVVVSVEPVGDKVRVRQEFSGGRGADLEMTLPAVVGLQASRQTPRYAPVSKVRQAMQAGGLTEVSVQPLDSQPGLTIRRMYAPGADLARRDARPASRTRSPTRSSSCFAAVP